MRIWILQKKLTHFSLFDKYLSERYSQPDLPITRSYPWQKSVYIFGKGPLASELEDPGTQVFLGESFVSQVDKAIQSRIKGTAGTSSRKNERYSLGTNGEES